MPIRSSVQIKTHSVYGFLRAREATPSTVSMEIEFTDYESALAFERTVRRFLESETK